MSDITEQSDSLPYKVLIVDDSSVIRKFLSDLISGKPNIQIVGEAENGIQAIDKVYNLHPEVVLLDIEMPEMDGITALPSILQICPSIQVIMVSTLTHKNAEISFKAISLGAADCLQKPEANIEKELFEFQLISKIQALGEASRKITPKKSTPEKPVVEIKEEEKKPEAETQPPPAEGTVYKKPDILAIGCSTGGPQALFEVFKELRNNIKDIPILITQHMPATFTALFAENIENASGARCFEAKNGMEVENGNIYIAPGDYHMLVEKKDDKTLIKLDKGPPENFCRPAVDPMLRSIANIYGSKTLLLIMTGMGHDGLEGAKIINDKGGDIIIQDEETSVVWGMPGAIANAKIYKEILPLEKIAKKLLEICKV